MYSFLCINIPPPEPASNCERDFSPNDMNPDLYGDGGSMNPDVYGDGGRMT